MQRRVGIGLLGLFAVLAVGLLITWLIKGRAAQDRVYCVNNLRELSQFAYLYADAERKKQPAASLAAIPAGTVVNPGLPPDRRMSWVPATFEYLNQHRQPTRDLKGLMSSNLPWDEGSNARLGQKLLFTLICSASPEEVQTARPPVTSYVGLAGVGTDAATLGLGPPIPPRAGCFRYDAPTPFDLISTHDGLAQTLLFGETGTNLGPWLRGGPGTVRGLDDAPTAAALIGSGGQFGGNHPEGAAFAAADGSSKFLTPRVDPAVFRALLTIAGGPGETVGD